MFSACAENLVSDIYLHEVIVRNNTPHYLKPRIKPEEKLRTMTFARLVFCRLCMCSRFVIPPNMRKRKTERTKERKKEREIDR